MADKSQEFISVRRNELYKRPIVIDTGGCKSKLINLKVSR